MGSSDIHLPLRISGLENVRIRQVSLRPTEHPEIVAGNSIPLWANRHSAPRVPRNRGNRRELFHKGVWSVCSPMFTAIMESLGTEEDAGGRGSVS